MIGFQDGRVWLASFSEMDAMRKVPGTYNKEFINLYTDYGINGFPSRYPPSGELPRQP